MTFATAYAALCRADPRGIRKPASVQAEYDAVLLAAQNPRDRAMIDDPDHFRKYGVADMSPARKPKPDDPLITAAEWAEIDARKANAAYLGWPTPEPQPVGLVAALARAFRRKAAAKREQVREGTTHPDKFPDVDIRSPEAAIAAQLAQSFEAMADDIEAIR